MKKINYFCMLVLLLGIILSGCGKISDTKKEQDISELPIEVVYATYGIDIDNPNVLIGDCHYAFVGRVEELTDTEYKNPVELEAEEGGTKVVSHPYTNYKIAVLQNIKGNLQQDRSIPLQKEGGVKEDGTAIELFEDDYLPSAGDICFFAAYVQPDGSMLLAGKNSSILIEANTAENRSGLNSEISNESDIVHTYVEAAKSPIESTREKLMSDYDAEKAG